MCKGTTVLKGEVKHIDHAAREVSISAGDFTPDVTLRYHKLVVALGAVIDLSKVPADVKKLVFSVTIHEGESRKQNFGQVSNAFIRVVNAAGGTEIARYDLSEDASVETAMIFGEVYRHGDEWKFKAVGQGFAGGLGPLAKSMGVNIG